MFQKEHLEKMREGIHLFNEQKYWECHEALEDIWAEDNHDPVRYVYWAVIQVAASCIHYRDKKLIGAQGMMTKAKDKFRQCHERHILSDLVFKYLDWKELEAIVSRIPDGTDSKLEDFSEVFNFRFKHYPDKGEL